MHLIHLLVTVTKLVSFVHQLAFCDDFCCDVLELRARKADRLYLTFLPVSAVVSAAKIALIGGRTVASSFGKKYWKFETNIILTKMKCPVFQNPKINMQMRNKSIVLVFQYKKRKRPRRGQKGYHMTCFNFKEPCTL